MSHFKYHLFFCTNRRDDGSSCCEDFNATSARDYVKRRCKELGIHGAGQSRVNTAGCLDRCDQGPVIVVYPEETWYTWIDNDDLDEIIDKHLLNGEPVQRLKIDK